MLLGAFQNYGINPGPQLFTTSAYIIRTLYAADLDADGDQDILSASEADDKIAWYANDGAGGFGPQQIISTLANGTYLLRTIGTKGSTTASFIKEAGK